MLKYNDEALVVKDDSDGFFEGVRVIVKNFSKNDKGEITYGVYIHGEDRPFYFKESDLQRYNG